MVRTLVAFARRLDHLRSTTSDWDTMKMKTMPKPKLNMTTSQSAQASLLLSMPLSLCVVFGAVASVASADTFLDIKYTDLVARLGVNVPTGAGIGMGQVEAPENTQGSYAPDVANPEFTGKTVTLLSGSALLPSWHGTEVGKAYYGNTQSIAKGVTSISVWEVNAWIQGAYLRVGQGVTQPLTPPAGLRVFNHSWIGSFGSAASDNDALRRLDYTVTRDNIFVAAGVNNGAGSVGQAMMAYCFNGVAVGVQLPARVTLEIVETEPAMKGQTASSSFKPAKLSNGARTMVPPHIQVGTRVVVQTEDGSYVERAKD